MKKEYGVIICEHIVDDSRPINLVVHNHDHTWEFMCGETDHPDFRKSKIVGLNHLIERDPTILPCKDLPVGCMAERANGNEWEFFEFDEEE